MNSIKLNNIAAPFSVDWLMLPWNETRCNDWLMPKASSASKARRSHSSIINGLARKESVDSVGESGTMPVTRACDWCWAEINFSEREVTTLQRQTIADRELIVSQQQEKFLAIITSFAREKKPIIEVSGFQRMCDDISGDIVHWHKNKKKFWKKTPEMNKILISNK